MKTIINKSDFRSAFHDADRKDQFSYEALGLLFDYFEQIEADTGEEIELDVIAICCEYSEDSFSEIARNYSIDLNDCDPESDDYSDQCKAFVMAYLNDNTVVVGETDTSIVYAQF